MRRATLRSVVVAAAVAAAGCFDITVPEGARVQCTSAAECPPGYGCRLEIELCVPNDSSDTEPPAVENVVVAPLSVGLGGELTVSFDVTEPLLLPPAVTLVLEGKDPRPLAISPRDDDAGAAGTGFIARAVAAGDEGEGAHALRAQLVDLAGNVATNVDLQSVTFDFTAPELTEIDVEPAVATDGTTITVAVRTTEPLDDVPTSLRLEGGRAFTLAPAGVDPLLRTFTLLVDGSSDAEGPAVLALSAADAAGNKTVRSIADALVLDFTAPAVEGEVSVPRPIVRAGQVALLSFLTTEPVTDVAVELVPTVGAGPSLPMTAETSTGRDLSFRREIAPGDADGSYVARIVTLVDAAGIVAAPSDLTEATLVIDQRSPSFVGDPTATPEVASLVAGNDVVTVRFTIDEPATATVRLGSAEVPCTSVAVADSNALDFTCTRGVTAADAEGVRGVTITVVDGAENSAFATAPSITVDFTAPALALGVVPERQARAGEVISLSAVAEEALDASSVVFDNGGLAFSAPTVAGRTASTFFPVPSGLEGSFDVALQIADLGGNLSAVAARTIVIDGVAPTLSSFALSSPRIAPDEVFTLTVQPSEVLAGPPVATFANGDVDDGGAPIVHPMTVASGPLPDGSFVLEGVGPATGQNQFYTITVLMTDVAGNPGADNPAVIVVDNAPPDLSGFDIAPAFALTTTRTVSPSRATGRTASSCRRSRTPQAPSATSSRCPWTREPRRARGPSTASRSSMRRATRARCPLTRRARSRSTRALPPSATSSSRPRSRARARSSPSPPRPTSP